MQPRLRALALLCEDAWQAEAALHDALDLCRELASLDESEIADVAFVAATDLRGTLQRLDGSVVEAARDDERARAARRVLRSIGALEQVLGIPRPIAGARERLLQSSLATRRRYASLRRSILAPAPPTDSTMARSLARVRLQVMLLGRSDEYDTLRRGDRDQVEELRHRLDEALADRDAIDLQNAERLWQDLAGFARLSAAINQRHELVENDTAIIDEATEVLSASDEIPTRLRMRLETLSGLDDELDTLIERYEWGAEPWRRALSVLHERLVRPATGRFTRTIRK